MKKLANVWRVSLTFRHILHRKNPQPDQTCCICNGTLDTVSSEKALHTVMIAASAQAEYSMGNSKLSKKCSQKDGVWYSSQRLEKEGLLTTADLDFTAFYDGGIIKKVLPVMLVNSVFFQSLVLNTHFEALPHQGVEATLARIRQMFAPIGDARRIIAKVKKACSKCRILQKQVVGLELADVHSARTTIAPPFYAIQMDIAMGLRGRPTKDSRKSFTCHALVIVCLLTSATSIMVLDGLETQSVVMALERHASRYGMPAHIFVDSGTQLEKLRDTHFSIRDLDGLQSQGRTFSLTVSTQKPTSSRVEWRRRSRS